MSDIRNKTLELLARGELALGVGARLARTTEIAKMMRASDYDWLLIDLEHGSLALEMVSQISIAAVDNGITPIVRVPTGQWGMASCVLDGGAQGILLPHIDTVEDARAVVHHLRFAPLGHRATLGGLPQYDYLPVSASQVAREVNASTLIALMLESPQAIDNAEAMAAVAGIDVLLIGINDLAEEMGVSGQLDHPKVLKACERVAKAAAQHNKHAGTGGIRDTALLRRYINMGFHFILGGNDYSFLMTAARDRARAVRGRE